MLSTSSSFCYYVGRAERLGKKRKARDQRFKYSELDPLRFESISMRRKQIHGGDRFGSGFPAGSYVGTDSVVHFLCHEEA